MIWMRCRNGCWLQRMSLLTERGRRSSGSGAVSASAASRSTRCASSWGRCGASTANRSPSDQRQLRRGGAHEARSLPVSGNASRAGAVISAAAGSGAAAAQRAERCGGSGRTSEPLAVRIRARLSASAAAVAVTVWWRAVSAGYCWDQAVQIAQGARDTWAAQIDALPTTCQRADCGMPKNCRAKVAEYLRMQYRMAVARDRRGGHGR